MDQMSQLAVPAALGSSGPLPALWARVQAAEKAMQTDRPSREEDLYAWFLYQANQLRSRSSESIDWSELAEELDEIVALARKETVSHLRNLLAHLLKWKYQRTDRSENSWRTTMVRTRLDLALLLESKNLRNYIAEKGFDQAYSQAQELAGSEMRLERHDWNRLFPNSCEWDLDTTLNSNFLPPLLPDSNGHSR